MNNKIYSIMTRNAKGTVLESSVQNVLDEKGFVRAQQILPNTTFEIIRFDLYTNRAVVNCIYKKEKFSALFDFDFLSESCIITNMDKNKIIESVYLPQAEIDTRLKYTRYEVGMGLTGMCLFGIIIGVILGGIIACH